MNEAKLSAGQTHTAMIPGGQHTLSNLASLLQLVADHMMYGFRNPHDIMNMRHSHIMCIIKHNTRLWLF